MSAFISKFYNIINVVLITLLISCFVILFVFKQKNDALIEEINNKNNKIVLLESNNVLLKASIEDQNKKIEANKNDYDLKIKQYKQWKNQPAKVKYKYITKEVKSNECEDIKKSIDNSIDRLHNNRLYN